MADTPQRRFTEHHEADPSTVFRTCSRCEVVKCVSEFYQNTRYKGGHTKRCKKCVAEAALVTAAKNPVRRLEIQKKWNAANKAKRRLDHLTRRQRRLNEDSVALRRKEAAQALKWRIMNPQKASEIQKRATAARILRDPDGERARRHNASVIRRLRMKIGAGRIKGADIARLLRHQKGKCWWCSKRLDKYHVDHRFALALGGQHDASNIVLSCVECNLRKNNKTPRAFSGRLL